MIPFLERLDPPVYGSEYYKNLNTVNDMPNCTKYCHDRAQEACGNKNLQLFTDRGPGGFPGASSWLEHSALPVSDTGRLGSICVCSDNGGSQHVMFIERDYGDGTFLISDSRYDDNKSLRNDRYWRKVDHVKLVKGQKPDGVGGCGYIIGFQLIPVNDIRVDRNESVDQVKVTDNRLHCRKGPSINAEIINEGCYVPQGIYNVLETKQDGDLTWCRVTDEAWFAAKSDWAELYLHDQPTPEPGTDISKLFAQIATEFNKLETETKKLQGENTELKKALSDIADIAKKYIS